MSGKKIEFLFPSGELNKGEKGVKGLLDRAKRQEPFLGWVDLPFDPNPLKECKSWLKKVSSRQKQLCVFGIGGSSLGARAVYEFINPKKKITFFENVDAFAFEQNLSLVDFKTSHFMFISKSGETSETLFQLCYFMQLAAKKKIKLKDHLTIITEDKESTLRKMAHEVGASLLNVPMDVGGRFSVLSQVGLAPLIWAGVNVSQLLAGAQWAAGQKEMVVKAVSFYIKTFEHYKNISVFWMYVDRLRTFGLWLEQLWAESLGKSEKRGGSRAPLASTPITCIGATDQHSLLQQFTEGARDKSFTFIRCMESEKPKKIQSKFSKLFSLASGKSLGELLAIEAHATEKILTDLSILTGRITIQSHKEFEMGALMFFYEMIVGALGECLEIDAFNQPGVEGVKKLTLGSLRDPKFKNQSL